MASLSKTKLMKPMFDSSVINIVFLFTVWYHHRKNSPKLLTRIELIEFFRTFSRKQKQFASNPLVTIGLVGYPNVGKSSTINALLIEKKVSVSATPGKTKHFQVQRILILCNREFVYSLVFNKIFENFADTVFRKGYSTL